MLAAVCPSCDWQRPQPEPQIGKIAWQQQLDGRIGKPYAVGVIAGSLVVLPVESGDRRDGLHVTLTALHVQTGEVVWSHALPPQHVASWLCVFDGLLYVSCENQQVLGGIESHIVAIDVQTGDVRIRTEIGAHSHSAPAAFGDDLCVVASDHHAYALSRTDGSIMWRSASLGSWQPAAPTVIDEAAYIGGFTHTLTRILEDGSVETLFAAPEKEAWFDLPPCTDDKRLFAACSNRRLYALVPADGVPVWSEAFGRGFTTAPTVGTSLYVAYKSRKRGEYLLAALSPEDGGLRWQFAAESHLITPPRENAGVVYCCSRKGMLYALDAGTGELLWQVEREAAVRAVPLFVDDLLIAATADGDVFAVYRREREGGKVVSAEIHRQQEQWLLAGNTAAKAGDRHAAASDFEQGDLPFVAAQFYEMAADPAAAAPLFARANQPARALQAWERVGDRRNMAEMHLRLQQPKRAADLLQAIGEYARAATLYHENGHLQLAADAYVKAGQYEAALALFDAMADQIMADTGEHALAASLALAQQLSDDAYLHFRAAGHTLIRVAQQAELDVKDARPPEALAQLWEQAADCFAKGLVEDDTLIMGCNREALRLRRLPDLVIAVQAERKLVEGRWDGLFMEVKNIGFGIARHVNVKVVDGEFDGRLDTQAVGWLHPGRAIKIRLNVRPRSAGSSVPISMQLFHILPDGNEVARTIHSEVPVHEMQSRAITSESEIGNRTRIQLHRDSGFDKGYQPIFVQGDYYAVENVKGAAVSFGRDSVAKTDSSSPLYQTVASSSKNVAMLATRIAVHADVDWLFTVAREYDISTDDGKDRAKTAMSLVKHMEATGNMIQLLGMLQLRFPAINWLQDFSATGEVQ